MKKKNHFILFATMILSILIITSCSSTSSTNNKLKNSEENKQMIVADNSVYDDIIAEYGRILNGEKLNKKIMTVEESGFAGRMPYINEDGVLEGLDESDEFGNTLDLYYKHYDINSDGIDELLVANIWDRDLIGEYVGEYERQFFPDYFSIWTIKNNKPKNLFWGADRFNNYSILENGVIVCGSSSSADNMVLQFYVINNDLSVKKVAAVSHDLDRDSVPEGVSDDSEYLGKYYNYYPNDTLEGNPSRAEYNKIINKYFRDPVKELQDKQNWNSI